MKNGQIVRLRPVKAGKFVGNAFITDRMEKFAEENHGEKFLVIENRLNLNKIEHSKDWWPDELLSATER